MPTADTAPTRTKRASSHHPGLSRNAGAPLRAALLALALLAPAGACVPAPFTFEETGTGGGGGDSSTANGGQGGASTSSGSSTSSTGTGMTSCGEGFVCVDAVPVGWSGPQLVLGSPHGGPKPPCPLGDIAEKLFADPPQGQHGCTPCNCTVIGAACSPPIISCWTNSACQGAELGQWQDVSAACVNDQNSPAIENLPGSCALTGGSSVTAVGSCSTSGGSVTNADDWGSDVHVCNAALNGGVACGADGMCEPVVPGRQLCIRKVGTNACPAGWDVSRVDGFLAGNDQRDCTSCDCNPASCSGGGYTVYDSLGCDAASANVGVNTANCTDVPNIIDGATMSMLGKVGTVEQNGCESGAEPTGAFIPAGPVTFCCKN